VAKQIELRDASIQLLKEFLGCHMASLWGTTNIRAGGPARNWMAARKA
jgi:hypothetical protein